MTEFKTIKVKIEDYRRIKLEAAKADMKIYEFINHLLNIKDSYEELISDIIEKKLKDIKEK